ncbi:unnamed protein product [Dovyalis caffra]|uniref:Uncharacterized protein n=1 Tax=Dovyalis caffra TaxID=77055 RepID=A0AAV1RJJ1_9ROSI|nr:unnamed protein product [Dovyalis caffra]
MEVGHRAISRCYCIEPGPGATEADQQGQGSVQPVGLLEKQNKDNKDSRNVKFVGNFNHERAKDVDE